MRTAPRPCNVEFAQLFSLVLLIACGPRSAPPEGDAAKVARGEYLVEFGQCHDCHSPKVFTAAGPIPDSTRLLSGHPADAKLPAVPSGILGPDRWGFLGSPDLTAFVGPWGVSFTANLTPDPTGLGSWTVEQFIEAMRTGKHLGVGRPILPPMPWHYVGKLTDEDLQAVFAYLRTLKPVSNAVPPPIPLEREAAPR